MLNQSSKPPSFQAMIFHLQTFWADRGCAILQPMDMSVGAGTFHPATALHTLTPSKDKDWSVAYVQPCRRPSDGRYGDSPNRLGHYYQFQVVIQPSPDVIQDWYIESLSAIGIKLKEHDIRFVEDNWASPTLGAQGLGWEVWCDGMEVSQFTYMQQIGGFKLDPIPVELTYGLERLAMYIQGVDNVFDLRWNDPKQGQSLYYRDLFHRQEMEGSAYSFDRSDVARLKRHFEDAEKTCAELLGSTKLHGSLALPAWDQCLTASHLFNLMDAAGTIGVAERQAMISRIRALAFDCARSWKEGA